MNQNDDTNDCFVCSKIVSTSDTITATSITQVSCDCLTNNKIHQECFDEWFNKQISCPLCRTAGSQTDEIQLQIRETVRETVRETIEQINSEEVTPKKNIRILVVGTLAICVICIIVSLLLINRNSHYNDDDIGIAHEPVAIDNP